MCPFKNLVLKIDFNIVFRLSMKQKLILIFNFPLPCKLAGLMHDIERFLLKFYNWQLRKVKIDRDHILTHNFIAINE